MHFTVLFTLFSGLTPALLIHENVAFNKATEIALTRSKWLSTFILDLKPYENILNGLSEDLGKARITAYSMDQFNDFPANHNYGRIIKGLKGEFVPNHQHTLLENYIELHVIHKN